MSRDDGFTIADLDTTLYADPKIVALARRLRDSVQTAAHVALFEALLLGSWGAGHRITLEEALPAWWLDPVDEIRANLQAVGLIGRDGRIKDRAWQAWFTPAWKRREARRESGRKGGQAKGDASSSDAQATLELGYSDGQARVEPNHGDAEPVRTVPSVPSGLTRGSISDVRPGRPLTVVHPSGNDQ